MDGKTKISVEGFISTNSNELREKKRCFDFRVWEAIVSYRYIILNLYDKRLYEMFLAQNVRSNHINTRFFGDWREAYYTRNLPLAIFIFLSLFALKGGPHILLH